MTTRETSRRNFLRTSSLLVAGGAVSSGLESAHAAHAFGDDEIRVGLIGCGKRGTAAACEALNTALIEEKSSSGPVRLVAMGDAYRDRLQSCYRSIKSRHRDLVDVPRDRQFAGLDAYRRVLASDVDVVILAEPPAFRPDHFESAVRAGKHVFMERPIAVDPPGVRRVIAAGNESRRSGLSVAVGLQRRHESKYRETIACLREGIIGEIVYTRVYWNGGGIRDLTRTAGQTEFDYQLRNWQAFNWLSGDLICERHVQNLDVSNWLMEGTPVECQGHGGGAKSGVGDVFDHHFLEYTYANGAKLFSQCRRRDDCWNTVAEYAHATQGHADISGGKIYDARGRLIWRTGGSGGHQAEQDNLFAALRRGDVCNEIDYAATSTMTAIMGRMASYSGQLITWEDAIGMDYALTRPEELSSHQSKAKTWNT